MLYIIAAAVHLLVCLLVLIGINIRVLSVHKYMFFVALLIPLWGVLIVLILHFQIAFDATDSAEIGVEKLKLESELYKSVTVDEKKADTAIPIEEALLINSARERRSIIMDVLNDNPSDYVEFLQKAGNNDDTEVVHYAVTAMVEISKENDYMLQKLETEHAANPDDMGVLTKYIDFLWGCLSQNLMQGQVEVMNRELFAQLMNKKIAVDGDIQDYARLVENELKRKNYDAAGEVISRMGERWPDAEEYILLKIQLLASLGKGREIQDFVKEIENSHIYMSSKTKEALAFWAS
ncbi:MAG: hypothetical protein E7655_04280 [Ruminococcaceae bacterium]|nr:hypothetical protein [Oscillospiraceae bacterium]